jgi:hypothetical protein
MQKLSRARSIWVRIPPGKEIVKIIAMLMRISPKTNTLYDLIANIIESKKGFGQKIFLTGRRFMSRGPLVFLRIFPLRNAPAGNHQLAAEDLMEDGAISRICR